MKPKKNDRNQGRLPVSGFDRKEQVAPDGRPTAQEFGAGVPESAVGSAVRNPASYPKRITSPPPTAKFRRCDRCSETIFILTLKNGQTLPFNADGSGVHDHDAKKGTANPRRVIFEPGLADFSKAASCGCENAVGIPTAGGEIRFDRIEWRWKLHKCARTLDSLDSGIGILAKWAAKWDVEPVLCLIVGVFKYEFSPPLYLTGIVTVTKERLLGKVEASRPPPLGSLAAWYENGDRKGILGSDGKWFDFELLAELPPRPV
jgi:hypothetical protein